MPPRPSKISRQDPVSREEWESFRDQHGRISDSNREQFLGRVFYGVRVESVLYTHTCTRTCTLMHTHTHTELTCVVYTCMSVHYLCKPTSAVAKMLNYSIIFPAFFVCLFVCLFLDYVHVCVLGP